MKNNLLFVDDDEFILQALMRQMRNERHEWNIEFASSGARALELMAERSFDLVFADMRMPKMDGIRLLTEVMHRSPSTIRVILSGQSERDFRFRTIGPAHQYLSKPCDPESIRILLREVRQLQNYLPDESLRDLVASISALPSLPDHVHELVSELQSNNTSVEAISSIVSRDPGMTAKILQLANSSFFGMPGRVTDSRVGVELLGLELMRQMTLQAGVFSQVKMPVIEGFCLDAYSANSLAVASAARKRTLQVTGDEKAASAAYSAGLLHDIGQLVLALSLPEQYATVLRIARMSGRSLRDVEQETLRTTHAHAGGYLLRLWGFSDSIINAVTGHHEVEMQDDD